MESIKALWEMERALPFNTGFLGNWCTLTSWRKSGPGDGRIAQVLLGSTGTGLLERGVSLSRRPSRDSGALPRKEREAEFSEEKGI